MPFLKRVAERLLQLTGLAKSRESDVTLSYVRRDDPEMEAAREQARATVGSFVKLLENPQPGTDYFVKKQFDEGENSEHIWLSDVTVAEGQFVGFVGNDPGIVKNISFDDEVRVAFDDISDWMVMRDGDVIDGGYTVDLLMKRQQGGDS